MKYLHTIWLVVCLLAATSCQKNLENIPAISINEFSIELPKGTGTLIKGVEEGDSIKAQIHFAGQTGTEFDPKNYSFVWTSLQNSDTLSTKPYLTYLDFENQESTLISCLLTVREKSTGIVKHAVTSVLVKTPTQEGWLLLNDQDGTAKLSMLMYTPQGYVKYVDIAKELGMNIQLNGAPISISSCDLPPSMGIHQLIGISTDQEIKFFISLNFTEEQHISSFLTQSLKPNFAGPVFLIPTGNGFYGIQNKNAYFFDILGLKSNFFSQINYFNMQLFNTSPYIARIGSETTILMYDEAGMFIKAGWLALFNSALSLELPFTLTGYQLLSIASKQEENQDMFTALLHNPGNDETYLLEFLSNGIVRNVKKIADTDALNMIKAKHMEIDLNTGYIIYTKESKIYAYDYKVGQTFLLLNFENEEITLVKMQDYIPTQSAIPGRVELYKELLRRLVVCTYNSSRPDNGGVFRTYTIPLGHQLPVKEVEERGFPKIVDANFVTIP